MPRACPGEVHVRFYLPGCPGLVPGRFTFVSTCRGCPGLVPGRFTFVSTCRGCPGLVPGRFTFVSTCRGCPGLVPGRFTFVSTCRGCPGLVPGRFTFVSTGPALGRNEREPPRDKPGASGQLSSRTVLTHPPSALSTAQRRNRPWCRKSPISQHGSNQGGTSRTGSVRDRPAWLDSGKRPELSPHSFHSTPPTRLGKASALRARTGQGWHAPGKTPIAGFRFTSAPHGCGQPGGESYPLQASFEPA